jgi:hypothetical protein
MGSNAEEGEYNRQDAKVAEEGERKKRETD